jgi:hypothetical protein
MTVNQGDESVRRSWAVLAIVLLAPLGGCGGKAGGGDPQAVAKQFDAAMKSGNLQKAAELFEYNEAARAQNSDWDTFGAGQRRLIIKKLQEEKAEQLKAFQSAYASANYQVGEAQVQGTQATVPLTGSAGRLTLSLVQEEGTWLIAGVR